MKQLYHAAGYSTFDLTECKIHRIDGKIIISYPSKWEAGDPQLMPAVAGRVTMRPYRVTDWEEVELKL